MSEVPWILRRQAYIKIILSCNSPIWGQLLWKKGYLSNPRTIYGALRELSEKGILKSVKLGNKRAYTLTEKGKKIRKHLTAIKRLT